MVSKITFLCLLAFVIACSMKVTIPKAGAHIFLPCKINKDCEYLNCLSGTPICKQTMPVYHFISSSGKT
ncbi:unnamed protein product [Eruca vesicaria subsp. sativa]|uniref:Nodule Cysteine-Rich (NCR) secreted peptide n=1 Tax=Eruca vesicaria subsp. sativa TaxID=29727 RepID=A0ABC8LYA5_ERUVS|nr:unnamed protein product [Eruca vesicaria subsp. sativa]